jgi:lysophospholipid acyltransferase (LPLAT)-like uncharacterized protein
MAIEFKYRFAALILRAISSTWRYRINGDIAKSPAVVAFWHGSMLPVWKYFAKHKPYAVVSKSKDGAILTYMLENWGYNVLRGSSSKGGKEVLNDMKEAAGKGYLLITPDGPRGPIHEFKPGAVIAAHRSSAALQLCGVNINHKICFHKSWDRFLLPLPFTKIELEFFEPILIPKGSSREEISGIIEKCQKELNLLNGAQKC